MGGAAAYMPLRSATSAAALRRAPAARPAPSAGSAAGLLRGGSQGDSAAGGCPLAQAATTNTKNATANAVLRFTKSRLRFVTDYHPSACSLSINSPAAVVVAMGAPNPLSALRTGSVSLTTVESRLSWKA